MTKPTKQNHAHASLNEAALADDIVKLLDESPLSYAHMQGLKKARAKAVARVSNAHQVNGHTLSLVGQFSDYLNHHRALSALGFVSIVLFTLIVFQQLNAQRALQNSDAFLLASELPPEAFADKGFDTWIEAKAQY